jgi:hypothetical protein
MSLSKSPAYLKARYVEWLLDFKKFINGDNLVALEVALARSFVGKEVTQFYTANPSVVSSLWVMDLINEELLHTVDSLAPNPIFKLTYPQHLTPKALKNWLIDQVSSSKDPTPGAIAVYKDQFMIVTEVDETSEFFKAVFPKLGIFVEEAFPKRKGLHSCVFLNMVRFLNALLYFAKVQYEVIAVQAEEKITTNYDYLDTTIDGVLNQWILDHQES